MSAAMAWGAGLRLYLVVFVVGLLGKFGYVPVPEALKLLTNPLVIGAAGFMSFIEFFADKIPWLDSVWDAIHTFLRIPAGAALAAGMLGDSGEGMALAAAIIGGTLTAGTHFGKAGTRAAANTSPEPFTNIGLSLAEESMVAGGLALAIANPLLFLFALLLFIVVLVFLIRFILKGLAAIIRRLTAAGTPQPPARGSSAI
ncbi:MAG: DUF4126 domain-containing protein [Burkholderiales bacterium]|nr:DUF4126 domain-containing protein [Burkholderiales bacterium]